MALPSWADYCTGRFSLRLAGTVPSETTALHSLGDKRVTWGITWTLIWYTVVAVLAVLLGAWCCGGWAIPFACSVIVVMGLCGLAASRYFRHVMLFFRSLVPNRRRYRRYRQLGAELFQQLENYRVSLSDAHFPRQPVHESAFVGVPDEMQTGRDNES